MIWFQIRQRNQAKEALRMILQSRLDKSQNTIEVQKKFDKVSQAADCMKKKKVGKDWKDNILIELIIVQIFYLNSEINGWSKKSVS